MSTREERQRAAYRKWYANHREELNAKRRERYRSDAAYRKKAITNSREYRAAGGKPEEAEVVRVVGDEEVIMFRISAAAKMVKRSPQVIREWEQRGLIPFSTVNGSHRVFTIHQVKLLQRCAEVMDLWRHQPQRLAKELEKFKKKAHAEW